MLARHSPRSASLRLQPLYSPRLYPRVNVARFFAFHVTRVPEDARRIPLPRLLERIIRDASLSQMFGKKRGVRFNPRRAWTTVGTRERKAYSFILAWRKQKPGKKSKEHARNRKSVHEVCYRSGNFIRFANVRPKSRAFFFQPVIPEQASVRVNASVRVRPLVCLYLCRLVDTVLSRGGVRVERGADRFACT